MSIPISPMHFATNKFPMVEVDVWIIYFDENGDRSRRVEASLVKACNNRAGIRKGRMMSATWDKNC